VTLDGHRLDLAALRSERYERPGALPTVRPGATIEEDLARRDFSVNAIALTATGPRRDELVDPFAGIQDLAARRLRVLHPRSFRDDATRLWRAARYVTRLRLQPDPETQTLIREGVRWLASISRDRLWAEFERIAGEPRPGAAFRLLEEWGVLGGVHRGWRLAESSRRALARLRGPLQADLLLALVLAPLDDRAAIARRLGASREAMRAVEDAARLLGAGREGVLAADSLEVLERTSQVGREAALRLDRTRQAPLQTALRRWERTRPHLDAGALRAAGVERGPELGLWLRRLRRERFGGNLHSAADARRLVAAELARSPPFVEQDSIRGASR
jgi:tRNA nucleotidyltransferase (CCA-adding enzyme)